MKEQKKAHKKGNWGIRSVYAALGVCLVAVAAAAWTTFESISSTLSGSTPDTVQSQPVEPTGETVSGVMEETESSSVESEVVSEEAEDTSVNATPETLQLPLENGVLKAFSGEELVYSQTLKDWRTHNGTDFQAESGEDVLSIADGTVTKVYDDGLLGNVVVVTSGEIEASYCGLNSEISVKEGETVAAGQVLGTVGEIPAEQAESTHLHLEVKRDGVYIDCETLMQNGQ